MSEGSELKTLPKKPSDDGWRFMRLAKAAAALLPSRRIPTEPEDITDAQIEELLKNPDNFTEENPDVSHDPLSETVIYQYGASVSWLSFNYIKSAVERLSHRSEFEGKSFKIVNKNWPYRSTKDLNDWMKSSLQWAGAGLLDTATSRIPFYNPMLPKIPEDGPPHMALLVMGGNDMLGDLDAVKSGKMSPQEFGEGVYERCVGIIDAMKEAGFQRVGLVPLEPKNAQNIIDSLEIPSEMVDELGVAFRRVAERFPNYVYVSPHDLYEGLNPETDYLDSEIGQAALEPSSWNRWEVYVRNKVIENDNKEGRRCVHPNPLGQAKVGKTMAATVSEMVQRRGKEWVNKSPCLKDHIRKVPSGRVQETVESGVVTDIQEACMLSV